jgi:signal transduction histidine kinase
MPQVKGSIGDAMQLLANLKRDLQAQLSERLRISFEETTHSIAVSTHLLSIPLAEMLHAINMKSYDGLENKVRKLRDFFDFSMAAVDKRRKNAVSNSRDTVTLQRFVDIIKRTVDEVFNAISSPDVTRDHEVSSVARELAIKQGAVTVNDNSDMEAKLSFHALQLEAVVWELIYNAIKYNDKNNPYLEFSLVVRNQDTQDLAIVLCAKNITDKPLPVMKKVVENMTHGLIDSLGIGTIRMACLVCDYLPPRWSVLDENGKTMLSAEIHVARQQRKGD